jgi:uncharacterized protein YeeX (DUF496 family)
VTDKGETLDSEQCRRLFSIGATVAGKMVTDPDEARSLLASSRSEQERALFDELSARNATFFDTEMTKLDSWAADVKSALEGEIKELDRQIRDLKKEAVLIADLERKIKTHRAIKDLEKTRHEKRRSLFEAQDDIDARKDELLSSTEARLKQWIEREELFVIRWRVV